MNSIVLGLTGQTGAGKSTVSEFMKNLGCTVISADKIAREATQTGSECLKRLADCFGYDIINNDGSCNRKRLAQKAFSSRKSTDLLNGITHPWILRRTAEYISECKSNGSDIIIFDAPQLFESGGEKMCDIVVSVTAPTEIRLSRIMNRDGINKDEALLRINAQFDESYYTSGADYVIDGSQPLEQVKEQVTGIIAEIRKAGA
ncbi:MAG: dephospho-CoA kinase [Acutalibacteraceae bacterium]